MTKPDQNTLESEYDDPRLRGPQNVFAFRAEAHGPSAAPAMKMRAAPWSAVAAATAFRLGFIPEWCMSKKRKGGSCCYRTPRSNRTI